MKKVFRDCRKYSGIPCDREKNRYGSVHVAAAIPAGMY